MDRDRLQDVLTEARVPEGLQDLVLAKGFDCPSDFAFAFPTIAELQPFIVSARDFWTANNVEDPESSVAAARLRKALAEWHRLSMSSAAPSEPAANSRSPGIQPNQIASWAEHLPPKLTSERVSRLLDADTTPSIRLLSLVHAVPEVAALAVSPFIASIPGTHGGKIGPGRTVGTAAPCLF